MAHSDSIARYVHFRNREAFEVTTTTYLLSPFRLMYRYNSNASRIWQLCKDLNGGVGVLHGMIWHTWEGGGGQNEAGRDCGRAGDPEL